MVFRIIQKKYWGILGSFMGFMIFTTAPAALNSAINAWAPISWWVDITEIQASNIDVETLHQSIVIVRDVKRELNGYPRQELYLENRNGRLTELYSTEKKTIVDYEPRESGVENLPLNFWNNKPGVAEKLQSNLTVGETYQWVWVIEFIRPNGNTKIQRYTSNSFQAI